MPKELYELVKDDIPSHIGVYLDGYSLFKRAKKQELKVDEQVLKNSMIRSLYREVEKQIRSGRKTSIEHLERKVRQLEKQSNDYRTKYWDLQRKVQDKYGIRWDKE